MSQFKIKLGARVRSRINGFEGIAVGRTQYLNMCNRYIVEPEKLSSDGKVMDSFSIDEQDLIVLDAQVHAPIPAQRDDPVIGNGGAATRVMR